MCGSHDEKALFWGNIWGTWKKRAVRQKKVAKAKVRRGWGIRIEVEAKQREDLKPHQEKTGRVPLAREVRQANLSVDWRRSVLGRRREGARYGRRGGIKGPLRRGRARWCRLRHKDRHPRTAEGRMPKQGCKIGHNVERKP